MKMPGRYGSEANGKYRYGFQGQEADDEVAAQEGNYSFFKYRMSDNRIGRFFAVDPLEYIYIWNSPYAFSENRVIDAIELEGREALILPRIAPRVGPRIGLPRIALPKMPTAPNIPVPPIAPTSPRATPVTPESPTAPSMPRTLETSEEIDWDLAPPKSPDELGTDWEETKGGGGTRNFKNKKTNERIRWDEAGTNKNGQDFEGHWHRMNPQWNKKMGPKNKYLDSKGNPANQYSPESHISPVTMLPSIQVTPNSHLPMRERRLYYRLEKKRYRQQMRKYRKQMKQFKRDMKKYLKELKEHQKENIQYA